MHRMLRMRKWSLVSKAKVRSSRLRNGAKQNGRGFFMLFIDTETPASLNHSRELAPNLNNGRAYHR